ncbi:hydrogenase subunit MbhD domain-containing protein [Aminiphilus circumscriptus]|uniref:hydrogenase subunit MbhD domain-containing protein n=1 Tax=Aminiphilus circumscriptus TaxID=290732 RepID=UPI0004923170|nr:hydrogenase subunit MbhD domain-containing protein [Aminiphilus circumscriptus]
MSEHLDSIVHLSVLCLIGLSGFFAIWFRDLLSSVISLSVLSLLLSVEFYILQAPDVAIAEAGIGAGLSMAIYVLALRVIRKTTVQRREDSR